VGPDQGAALRVYLLGRFRVEVGTRTIAEGAWRRRKAAALVKLLALALAHRLHRDQLMEALWPDSHPEAAANSLYQAVHAARRALEPDRARAAAANLRRRGAALVLGSPGGVWTDVEAFETAAAAARLTHDAQVYQEAVDLYGGELLPDDHHEDWAAARREALRERYTGPLADLAGLYQSIVADGFPDRAQSHSSAPAHVEPAAEAVSRAAARSSPPCR
jgi:DNA-binding SARP family transcriptional activator